MFDTDAHADFEAELARDDDRADWTDEQWADFEDEQRAAAFVSAERHAERQLCAGYAT
jgi:hypothetical protein